MIHWAWVILAAFGGFILGLFTVCALASSTTEDAYRAGYQEGHHDGFLDGLKELQRVG